MSADSQSPGAGTKIHLISLQPFFIVSSKANTFVHILYTIQSPQSDLRTFDASAAAIRCPGDTGPDIQLDLRAQSWILPLHAAEIPVSNHSLFTICSSANVFS